jgi:hypothetical protein
MTSAMTPTSHKPQKPLHKRMLSAIIASKGMYGRVARKLGRDPSYVSRVARGERKSKAITAALNAEIAKVLSKLKA